MQLRPKRARSLAGIQSWRSEAFAECQDAVMRYPVCDSALQAHAILTSFFLPTDCFCITREMAVISSRKVRVCVQVIQGKARGRYPFVFFFDLAYWS